MLSTQFQGEKGDSGANVSAFEIKKKICEIIEVAELKF